MGAEQSVGRHRSELESECSTCNIAASDLCVTCGVQSQSQSRVLSSLQPTAAVAESFIATINACGDICSCNYCYCCCCRCQQCCYSQTVDISDSSRPHRERRQIAAATVSKKSSDEMHQLVQGEAANAYQQQLADSLQSSTTSILNKEEQTRKGKADKQCSQDDCAQPRSRNQRKQNQQQLHNINNEPTNHLKSRGACKTLKGAASSAAMCLASVFPILSSFGGYKLPADLITDLTAGFTMGIIQLPQGMAYATLAGVEPIVGLYVSFVPVLVMALMGTSRHVSYGTFAICSLVFANACDSVRNTLEANGARLTTGGAANRAIFAIATAAANRSAQVGDALVIVDNHRQKINDLLAGQQQASILQRVQNRDQMQMRPLDDIGELLATGTAVGDLSGATTTTPPTMLTPLPFTIQELPSQLEILTTLCLLVGCVQLAMACVRLGLISLVFSDNLVSAYTSAAALHVLSLQLDGLFDIPSLPSTSLQQQQQTNTFQTAPTAFKLFWVWRAFGARLATHANATTALLTAVSLVYLYSARYLLEPALERRLKRRLSTFPVELALMAVVSMLTANFSLQDAPFNVKIVGQVPVCLPSVALPRVDFAPFMLQDAVKIAIITFALSVSFASSVARTHRTQIAANRELAAMGSANIVGSLFGCFPIGISLSRTALQSRLNPKSQLCSVFSCALVLSVILYFASYLHSLPKSTLNCIIVVALRNVLLQVRDLPKVWRTSRLDGVVWLITFATVVVFDIIEGLLIGISISLAIVFFRLLAPNCTILGKLPNSDIFVELHQDRNDANCNNAAQELKGIKVIRLDSPLCYLNRSMFKAQICKILLTSNRRKKESAKTASLETIVIFSQQHHGEDEQQREQKTADELTDGCQGARDNNQQQQCNIKVLVVDCSALTYCDASGVSTLVELIETFGERKNLTVYLAACRLRLVEMLKALEDSQCGDGGEGGDAVRLEILRNNIFPSVQTAVAQAEQQLMKMMVLQHPNKIFQRQQDDVTDEPSPNCDKC